MWTTKLIWFLWRYAELQFKRLDYSSWCISLLYFKNNEPLVFEWAVESQESVSCQGESPEVINIIYCDDTSAKKRKVECWNGKIYCLAWCGAVSWLFFCFFQLEQSVQGKSFLRKIIFRRCRMSSNICNFFSSTHMHPLPPSQPD